MDPKLLASLRGAALCWTGRESSVRNRHSVAHVACRRALATVHLRWAVSCFSGEVVAHRIGIIGGDGIGPEAVGEALKVVRAAGADLDTVAYDLGGARYLRTGEVLPDPVLDELRTLDAILLGAVGTPDVPPGVLERGLLLRLRFALDLYINLRPFTAFGHAAGTAFGHAAGTAFGHAAGTAFGHAAGEGLDFVVVRENTEGVYVGEGGFLRKGTPQEVATQGSVNTRMG